MPRSTGLPRHPAAPHADSDALPASRYLRHPKPVPKHAQQTHCSQEGTKAHQPPVGTLSRVAEKYAPSMAVKQA